MAETKQNQNTMKHKAQIFSIDFSTASFHALLIHVIFGSHHDVMIDKLMETTSCLWIPPVVDVSQANRAVYMDNTDLSEPNLLPRDMTWYLCI